MRSTKRLEEENLLTPCVVMASSMTLMRPSTQLLLKSAMMETRSMEMGVPHFVSLKVATNVPDNKFGSSLTVVLMCPTGEPRPCVTRSVVTESTLELMNATMATPSLEMDVMHSVRTNHITTITLAQLEANLKHALKTSQMGRIEVTSSAKMATM